MHIYPMARSMLDVFNTNFYTYNAYSHIGVQSYKKGLDYDVWIHCYLEYARKPSPFYPQEFEDAATAILERDFNMTKENVTLENAEPIYLHMVQTMSPPTT